MIKINIDINRNKLEEFVRVLLPEYYSILDEKDERENDVEIEVIETEKEIKIDTKLVNIQIGSVEKSVRSHYKKVNKKYFDQAEVMAKTSLLKLFEKTEDYMWGALIGVRPTKIVRRFLNMGISYDEIANILEKIYFVSPKKIKLLVDIAKRQEQYLDKETIGIYIGVAFCPTKCSYCSFPAYLLRGKYKERYGEYIDSLYREIKEIGELTKELGLKINTIYIGGGTPSILTSEEIEKLLDNILENYDLSNLKEFTFEAGRIDTLNREKMKILKQKGINKISINPQSFNEKTLKLVNRYHNQEQFDLVYNLAKEFKLDINMDLILGLPRETTEDVIYTMNKISEYDMENLTIHNLAIKTASRLNKENYRHKDVLDFEMIYTKIEEVVEKKGLKPYYMYRQKNSFQWGENLGYSLKDKDSIYNIEMIEENKTIIGIGAGAITKLIWKDKEKDKDNIKRLINPKDPLVWIDELSERLENKKEELRKMYE